MLRRDALQTSLWLLMYPKYDVDMETYIWVFKGVRNFVYF